MGKARRLRKAKKRSIEQEATSIYKDEKGKGKKKNIYVEALEKIENEMKDLGLPTEFSSTKGQHIEGQINVEARRMGMIRKYQSFQRRKLKEWQKTKIRGSKVKQRKNAAKVIQ